MPKSVDNKMAWAILKATRMGNRENIPITESGQPFSIFLTKEHLKNLSYIDSYTSGTILSDDGLPTGAQKIKMKK